MWTKRETETYLFAEPHIFGGNLFTLASIITLGERRWDDLHLHPYSVPGRHLTTFDLSHLHQISYSSHMSSVIRACTEILALTPNLAHIKLPTGPTEPGLLPFDKLRLAPFANALKALEGLQVDYNTRLDDTGQDPLVVLLRHLPNLEMLSLDGPGDIPADTVWEEHKQVSLKLDKLRTLVLHGVKCGVLLNALTHSELPALQRLVLTSYHQHMQDLTHAFQQAHGLGILSLTYLATSEWPTVQSVPSSHTLDLHPNLMHLSFLIPNSLPHLNTILSSALPPATAHPLRSLTVPRWNGASKPSLHTGEYNIHSQPNCVRGPSRFLNSLVRQAPPKLTVLNVDGFRWVRAELGLRALMTGDSGEMRVWSEKLKQKGIEMRDVDGKGAPAIDWWLQVERRGRRTSYRTEQLAKGDQLDEDGG